MASARPKSPAAKRASSPAAATPPRSVSPAASRSRSPTTERAKSPSSSSSSSSKIGGDAWMVAADAGDIKALKAACTPKMKLNPNYQDEKKRSLLQMAAFKGRLPMVEYLLEQKANVTSEILFGCMLRGHGGVLTSLLAGAQGLDVNTRDFNERTLLHAALDNRLTSAAQYLLTHGADLNAVDRNKRSILAAALKGGCIDIVLVLCRDHGHHLAETEYPLALHGALSQSDDWSILKRFIANHGLPITINVPSSFFIYHSARTGAAMGHPYYTLKDDSSLFSLAFDMKDEDKLMWLMDHGFKLSMSGVTAALALAMKENMERLLLRTAERIKDQRYTPRQWMAVGQQCAVGGSATSLAVLCAHGLDLFATIEGYVDQGYGDSARHDIPIGEIMLMLSCLCTNVSLITHLLSFGVPRSWVATEWARSLYSSLLNPPKYDEALVNAAIERGSRVYRLGLTKLLVDLLHNDTTKMVYDYLLGRDLQYDLTTEGGEGMNFDDGPVLSAEYSLAHFFRQRA